MAMLNNQMVIWLVLSMSACKIIGLPVIPKNGWIAPKTVIFGVKIAADLGSKREDFITPSGGCHVFLGFETWITYCGRNPAPVGNYWELYNTKNNGITMG